MMKTAVVFALIVCGAVSALSLAEDEKNTSPASMIPAEEFINKTTPKPPPTTTTKPPPKPTTKPPPTTTTKPPLKPTTKPPPTTTTKPPLKPTTKPPPTTTTKPPPTTTTKPPPTTTPKPPPKPTTKPTPKPTTKPTPKPTTKPTPKPTTKPTPKPTPPKPTPPTQMNAGNYSVTTDKKVICLVAQMALQIRLVTPKDKGNFIVQPNMTAAKGGCDGSKANLTLVFKEGTIAFMFNKSADNTVSVHALSFNLSYPLTPGGKTWYTASNKSMHLFKAKVGHSYSCKSESVYMGNGLYLDVNQDKMQAFNLTKASGFGTPDVCAADQPDYRVAIAVGVTLLVLIVIVVVAYLVGRRKRANGYQSL